MVFAVDLSISQVTMSTAAPSTAEDSADRNVEIWKIKKLIRSLEMARGSVARYQYAFFDQWRCLCQYVQQRFSHFRFSLARIGSHVTL